MADSCPSCASLTARLVASQDALSEAIGEVRTIGDTLKCPPEQSVQDAAQEVMLALDIAEARFVVVEAERDQLDKDYGILLEQSDGFEIALATLKARLAGLAREMREVGERIASEGQDGLAIRVIRWADALTERQP